MINRLAATGLGALTLIASAASFSAHSAAADDDLLGIKPFQIDVDGDGVGLPDLTSVEDVPSSLPPLSGAGPLPLIDPLLSQVDALSGDAEDPLLTSLPHLDAPQSPPEQDPVDNIGSTAFDQPPAGDSVSGPTDAASSTAAGSRCPVRERHGAAFAVVSAAGSPIGPSGPVAERPAPEDVNSGTRIGAQILDPFVPSAIRDSLLAVLGAAFATLAAWTWLRYQQREEARLMTEAGSVFEGATSGDGPQPADGTNTDDTQSPNIRHPS